MTSVPLNKETYLNYRYIIDFTYLIYHKHKLPNTVICNLAQYIDFPLLSSNQRLDESIIRKFLHLIPIHNLIYNQVIPYDLLVVLLDTYSHNFDTAIWHTICKKQKLSAELIHKYIQHIDWHALSENKDALTYSIIHEFHDKLSWMQMTNLGLSEEILLQFLDKLNYQLLWGNISFTSKLSDCFIKKYINRLNVMALITCQDLSEETILYIIDENSKNQNYSNQNSQLSSNHNYQNIDTMDLWHKIANCQALSAEFIQKYKDFLPTKFLIQNKKIKRQYLAETLILHL